MKEMHLVVRINFDGFSKDEHYYFLSLVIVSEFINKLNRLVNDGTIKSWFVVSSEVKDYEYLA